MALISIEQALTEIRLGKMLIICDDEDRENEGDLFIPAEKATPEAINFMATYGRGLICLSMTGERLDHLQIPMMVQDNTSAFQTAFCVSIEAKHKTTTGISAPDRAATVLTAIDPGTRPSDLARPGHVFPLRAKDGGVLRRPGQTEAAVDLARLAGLYPAGVICEVMKDDGTMARMPDLLTFSELHGVRHRDHRRPHQVPAQPRVPREARGPAQAPHALRRVPSHRLREHAQREDPPGPRHGLLGGGRARARAHAQRVPHGRCAPEPALRLRRPAGSRHGRHRPRGARRHRLPPAGGPRHRPAQQAQGLRAPGPGHGHGGGQRGPGLRRRRAGLRHRRPDPPRPGPAQDPPPHQQPQEAPRPLGIRHPDRGPDAPRGSAQRRTTGPTSRPRKTRWGTR